MLLRSLILILLFVANTAFAEVDFITVKKCRSYFFGKANEGETQKEINEELKKELNKVNAKIIFFIKYGDEQTILRSKENACILATAWYSK
jgi:hypothetical protein